MDSIIIGDISELDAAINSINENEYQNATDNIKATYGDVDDVVGVAGGAATGAVVGSVFPIVGTAVGGTVGATVGLLSGLVMDDVEAGGRRDKLINDIIKMQKKCTELYRYTCFVDVNLRTAIEKLQDAKSDLKGQVIESMCGVSLKNTREDIQSIIDELEKLRKSVKKLNTKLNALGSNEVLK